MERSSSSFRQKGLAALGSSAVVRHIIRQLSDNAVWIVSGGGLASRRTGVLIDAARRCPILGAHTRAQPGGGKGPREAPPG